MADTPHCDSLKWVEIIEPQSRERMFANPTTGEIVFTPPEGVEVKPMSENQWWELYDQSTGKNYYYNGLTGDTVWVKPSDDADIIPLTKLQSVPREEEAENQPESGVSALDTGENQADEDGNKRSSDIFSRGLGTISPLSVEIQGERYSSIETVDHPSPHLHAPSQNSVSHDQHYTEIDVDSTYHHEHTQVEDETRFPSPSGERTGVNKRDGSIPSYVNVTIIPHSTTSPEPDNEVFSSKQPDDEEASRRPRSLEQPGAQHYDMLAQGMSFEQKSRTLDMSLSKPKKRRERLGSNPNMPPAVAARTRTPTHPAPKPPPVSPVRSVDKQQKSPVHRGMVSKAMSVDSGLTDGTDAAGAKKMHSRAKSDIPPAPPPFKPLTRPATISSKPSSKEVGKLEHFKELAQHRTGFFRKKVTIANMLAWTKDPIKRPMILTRDKQLKKDAVDMFKLLLQCMGDRRTKVKNPDDITLEITTRAWEKKGLRDEIYIQLCRQTTANSKPKSLERGWQLFAVCLAFFPPSIKFRSYLEGYLWRHVEPLPENVGVPVEVYAQYCHKRIEKMAQSGAKKGVKKPSIEEIMHAKEAPFHPSMFGASIEEVMELQAEKYPGDRVPWVVRALTSAVLQLNGPQTEGIFRVPGDIDEVNLLKLQVEQGQLAVDTLTDPHIPASLLKLWFRELEDPLIPEEYYQECINNSEHQQNALSLVDSLPDLNKEVLFYLVGFLKKFITPENIEATKMGVENIAMVWAPNFLRCPSDDHTLIFQNTRKEMGFLRLLLKYLVTDKPTPSS